MAKSLPIEKRINPLKKRMIHILHKDVYDKINELADRLNSLTEKEHRHCQECGTNIPSDYWYCDSCVNNLPTPPADKEKCQCHCHLPTHVRTMFCKCKCSKENCNYLSSPQLDMEEIEHEIFEYIWDIDEVTFDKAREQAKKILDFLTANYEIVKKK